eukprot:1981935-Rhodomonas_salina.2
MGLSDFRQRAQRNLPRQGHGPEEGGVRLGRRHSLGGRVLCVIDSEPALRHSGWQASECAKVQSSLRPDSVNRRHAASASHWHVTEWGGSALLLWRRTARACQSQCEHASEQLPVPGPAPSPPGPCQCRGINTGSWPGIKTHPHSWHWTTGAIFTEIVEPCV